MKVLFGLFIIILSLEACIGSSVSTALPTPILQSVTDVIVQTATLSPNPSTTLTLVPTLTATLTPISELSSTPDLWQIQSCRTGPSIIALEDDWIWNYSGDIEGRGEVDMLLNFTKNNEILGFAFDSGHLNEYKVSGCVIERGFTMWLQQDDVVVAIIQGEFPAIDPRGHYQTSSENVLYGDVITGLLIEKSNPENSLVYLNLSRGTAGTMNHRFQLAGVENDKLILNAAQRFLQAVAANDHDQVTKMISLPLDVKIHLGKTTEIQTIESFLAQYETIFDGDFKERLAITFPNYLMAAAGNFIGEIGLSVYGGGGIVFNEYGKVIAIYNWEESELPPTPALSDTRVPTPTLSADCGVTKLGTPGTQLLIEGNTPDIWLQGVVRLCTNSSSPALETMFDLDSGNVDIERADIKYETGSIFIYFLFEINGALSQYWSHYGIGANAQEPSQPSYEECQQQYKDPNRWESEPVYLCVITNEGRVSRVKVEEFSPILSVSWIEISFVTWKK